MSLISSLFTGVTGLAANAQAMEIIGDNISNVNTVGFKSSKAVFSDIFSTILRSEEHTSELQSQAYRVCRLLLEKKKTTHNF